MQTDQLRLWSDKRVCCCMIVRMSATFHCGTSTYLRVILTYKQRLGAVKGCCLHGRSYSTDGSRGFTGMSTYLEKVGLARVVTRLRLISIDSITIYLRRGIASRYTSSGSIGTLMETERTKQ